MAPIRIAFIGLSAAGWAKTSHFPYLKQSSKFQITGICNSSKESGEAAIKSYGLPASTKAYSSPEEMAEDANNYDLAVCAVRVDKHFAAIKPIIMKGKASYVEWPLGKNSQEARELLDLAKQHGSPRTVVGLQARHSPLIQKVRQLVAEGRIGRVLSSNVQASGISLGQVDGESLGRIMNHYEVGANLLSVHFAHMLDYVLYGLSSELSQFSGVLSTQRTKVQLKHSDGTLSDDTRETPDQMMLQGHLQSGGVLSMHFRGGPPFKDTPGFSWRIYGETGEIEVTSSSFFLQFGYEGRELKVHDHVKDEVEIIDWVPKSDGNDQLPPTARDVGEVYEAFADGRPDGYADWEQAVQRQELLDKIAESSRTGMVAKL